MSSLTPSKAFKFSLFLKDEEATKALARDIAHCCYPGMIIYLQGQLGAGKTSFARGFLHGLGYPGRIKSPTFTLVEPYIITKEMLSRLRTDFSINVVDNSDDTAVNSDAAAVAETLPNAHTHYAENHKRSLKIVMGNIKLTVYHFDFYRLMDPKELNYLGLDDYINDESICLIEWPEKACPLLPTAHIQLQILVANDVNSRIVKLVINDHQLAELIQPLIAKYKV